MPTGNRPSALLLSIALVTLSGCSLLGFGWDGRDGRSKSMRDDVFELGVTPLAEIPAGGSAHYSGYMNAEVGDREMFGNLDMVADFGSATVTGSISGVRKVSGILVDNLSGSLDVGADGSSIRGNSFSTSITGTLVDRGSSATYNWNFYMSASGRFYGDDAEAVHGTLSGRVVDTFIWPTSHEVSGFIVGR